MELRIYVGQCIPRIEMDNIHNILISNEMPYIGISNVLSSLPCKRLVFPKAPIHYEIFTERETFNLLPIEIKRNIYNPRVRYI